MTTILRRAGTQILAAFASAASPGADSAAVQWFAKTIAGVIQFFAEDSDGLIYQTTPSVSVAARMAYYGDDFVMSTNTQQVTTGGSIAFATISQGSPGLLHHSVSTSGQQTYAQAATTSGAGLLIIGTGLIVVELRSRTVTAQDGSQQWTDRFGLGDTTVGDQANGIYFESDRATNGDNDYRICAANGGTRTKTTTSLAPTANTFERWRFTINAAADSIQAYMNDTAAGSAVTTNIPTAAPLVTWFSQIEKTLGNTARTIDRDYAETYQVLAR